MKISLQLDTPLKRTLSELFFASAQTPVPGLESRPYTDDALAIFRIAKEFSLTSDFSETHAFDPEDLARLLRFSGWLMSYDGPLAAAPSDEKGRDLRWFFATVMLQAQAQYSGFESLLRSFGVDRHLLPQVARTQSRKRQQSLETSSAGLNVQKSERTHQVQIQVNSGGAQLTTTTTESNWTASGWKQKNT